MAPVGDRPRGTRMKRTTDENFFETISGNVSLLRLAGLVSVVAETSPRGRGPRPETLSGCVAFLCLFVYSVSYAYDFAINGAYLETALQSLAMVISIVGAQLRFTILWTFRGEIAGMLALCESLWSGLEAEERPRVERYARKVSRVTRGYALLCLSTILFYAIAGFLAGSGGSSSSTSTSTYNSTYNSSEKSTVVPIAGPTRSLPYASLVEIRETPAYEIAYFLQILAMTNIGFTCVAMDTLGPLIAFVACGHFEVVGSRLVRLSTGVIAARPEKALVPCLRYHQTLLGLCENLERRMHGIFLTQLLGSTYNVALVGFKLAGNDPDRYKYSTQLCIAMIQLFLCNWPADVLRSESEAVGRAAYSLPWYRRPRALRTSIGILLHRSQRPVRLTAGKFLPLSLETFASMVSTAASFFTVVRNAS